MRKLQRDSGFLNGSSQANPDCPYRTDTLEEFAKFLGEDIGKEGEIDSADTEFIEKVQKSSGGTVDGKAGKNTLEFINVAITNIKNAFTKLKPETTNIYIEVEGEFKRYNSETESFQSLR